MSGENRKVLIRDLRPDINWDDEDRVGGLFSPFRERDLNPHMYDVKMSFWKDGIEKWLALANDPRFSIDDVINKLCSGLPRRPHCLESVIKSLEQESHLTTMDDLQQRWDFSQASWAQWTLKVAKKGVIGFMGKLVTGSSTEGSRGVSYVHLPTLKKLSSKVLCELSSNSYAYKFRDSIFLKKDEIEILDLTSDVLELTLANLCHQGDCKVIEVHGTPYLKVSAKKGANVRVDEANDKGVLSLWHLRQELESQVEDLNKSETRSMEKIKVLLKSGKKSEAKSNLKRVKLTRKMIEQKTCVCDNFTSMLMQIENTADQAKIVSTYQEGLKALNSQLSTLPSAESTEETLDEIADCIQKVEEISDLVSKPLEVMDDVASDEAVEKELEDLIMDEDLIDKLQDLTIPSSSPRSSPEKKCPSSKSLTQQVL